MNDLTWTIDLMSSDDYQRRLFAEYWQTRIRYERLTDFCNRIEVAIIMKEEEPKHDVPLKLLQEQMKAMANYLHILELRAIIEKIDLETTNLNLDVIEEDIK